MKLAVWPRTTFLGGLPAECREEILRDTVIRHHEPGERIAHEGDPGYHVILNLRGWIKTTAVSESGIETLLEVRGGGDLVGEESALEREPRIATIIAAGKSQTVAIHQERFLAVVSRDVRVSLAFSRSIAGRLRWSMRRRIDFNCAPVEVRLARVLLDLAGTYGKNTRLGQEINLTQAELAALAGASLPSAHRSLTELRSNYVLSTGYRSLIIADIDALQRIASLERGTYYWESKAFPYEPFRPPVPGFTPLATPAPPARPGAGREEREPGRGYDTLGATWTPPDELATP